MLSGSTKNSRLKNKTKSFRACSFEEHISCAEEILIKLEKDELTLEESVDKYNEALTRIGLAKKILEKTQSKIEVIEGKGENKMSKRSVNGRSS